MQKYFKEVLEDACDALHDIEEINNECDLFCYGYPALFKNQQQCEAYFKDLNNTIARLKTKFENLEANEEDYEQLCKHYQNLKDFITQIINEYNDPNDPNDPEVNLRKFIEPKLVKLKSPFTPTTYTVDLAFTQLCSDLNIGEDITHNSHDNVFMPQILSYDKPCSFKNKDLITTIDKLETHPFFGALLHRINKKAKSFKDAHEKAKNTSTGYRKKAQDGANERIKEIIEKEFNELYGKSNEDAYKFEFLFEENNISLCIYKGKDKDVLEIEKQSSGFQWFFSLYFDLLYGKKLKEGDIVIMDEPASNLSVPARKEWRNLLKDYGEKHGITFVIITHDPFLVDIDHLDEIRIIYEKTEDNKKGVGIINDFSRIAPNDTDTLLRIKQALGVGTEIFYGPKMRKIFVEGITDYNYLTAFKKLYEAEKEKELPLIFIPINGVGRNGEYQNTLEKLLRQEDDVILLLDSDGPAQEIKKLVEEKKYALTIVMLDDIDKKLKTIENLFAKKDLERYGLQTKAFIISSAFKRKMRTLLREKISEDDKEEMQKEKVLIEDETKENFYELLEHLSTEI